MKLIPKGCANPLCEMVFMVSAADFSTRFHSEGCKQHYELLKKRGADLVNDPRIEVFSQRKNKKCLDMASSAKMEESGTEDGEQLSNSKEESLSKEKESELPKSSKKEEKEHGSNLPEIQTPERRPENTARDITSQIETEKIFEKKLGEEVTVKNSSPTKGNIMQETSKSSESKSMKTDSEENLSVALSPLSIVLNEEKENSVKSLNESSKLLVGFAKSIIQGKTDDQGELIQRPQIHEIETAIRCAEAARNIQKTKLDFLKFGFDISKSSK